MSGTPESDRGEAQTLVIAGAGLAGWLVAAACALTLGKAVRITIVGEDEEPEFLPIATAGRRFCEFNKLLRIPEETFMASSGAYFRLGSQIKTASGSQKISVGQLGKSSWLAPFYHFWLRGKTSGITRPLLDYCAESVGAKEGKYSTLPNYPSEHGYQFDVHDYTSRLKELALGLGVQHKNVALKEHGVDTAEKGIRSVEIESGERLFGDLFVDCTGDQATLISAVSGEPRESWRQWLPEDSLIAVYQGLGPVASLYTPEQQNTIGNNFRLFSQGGQLNIQSYSRDSNATELALTQLQQSLEAPNSITHRKLWPGTFRNMWVKNCVSLGAAAGYVDYHEPTQLQLIFRGILRLLAHFPSGESHSCSASHFNREMTRELHAMRDCTVLRRLIVDHSCDRSDIPDSLRKRISLFEEAGFVECRDDELFKENYWAQMLLLAGVVPKQLHPVALNMNNSTLEELLTTTQQDVVKIANSFADHTAFVERFSRRLSRTSATIQEWHRPAKPIINTEKRSASDVVIKPIGLCQTPVITINDVGIDWIESLRRHASELNFSPDRANYYPGMRCNLPNEYVLAIVSILAKLVSDVYKVPRNLTPNIFQASFSLVTQAEQTLTTAQCIPHFDTTKPYSFAILHYLSPGEHGHTGFFRHLPTGLERVSADSRQLYLSEIDRYFDLHGQPQKQYMTSGNDHFELIDKITYQQHRLAVYPSSLIHSAMIVPENDIHPDPMKGRLTANIFLEFNP